MSNNTIFEDLKEEVGYESGRSPFFYRRAFRRLTQKYLNIPEKFIFDEKIDSKDIDSKQDKNVLRRYPKEGHIFMFEYTTSEKNVRIFDPLPLVYTIKANNKEFIGCNLHMIHPIKRMYVIENLKNGKITLPYNSISKYIISQVNGFVLDIAFDEWEIAANLPIESLISIKNGEKRDLPLDDVWKEKNRSFRKMLKGSRIYRSYGKNDKNFKGN